MVTFEALFDPFRACFGLILRRIRNGGDICLQKTNSDPLAESRLSNLLGLSLPLNKTQ